MLLKKVEALRPNESPAYDLYINCLKDEAKARNI